MRNLNLKTTEEVATKVRVDLKLEKILEKHQTLLEVMQMPGTTITKKAEKQLSKYAKNPPSFLRDVNKMMAWDSKHKEKHRGKQNEKCNQKLNR